MKKIRFSLAVILFFCLVNAAAQVYPVRVQPENKNSFSLILLPDPQSYNKFDANQPLFELQTAWIANNIEPLRIKGVLCTGDLVEQNEIRIPDGTNGNQTSEEQWKAASRAFERLDTSVPETTITATKKRKTVSAAFPIISLPNETVAGKSHSSKQV